MAITDKTTGVWGLDQTYNKINQGSIWNYQVGQLWSVGRASGGRLAQNGLIPYSPSHRGLSSPVQIGSDSTWSISEYGDIKGNSSGSQHAIKSDGTLWTWGGNSNGEQGTNDRTVRSSPVQVGSDTTWKNTITTSMSNTTRGAIKTDGTLWMWGMGEKGTLGLNQPHNTKLSSPTQIPGTTWKMISTCDSTNGAVKTDGTLWIWGNNAQGQLAQNNLTQRSSPVQIPGTTWNYIHCGYGAFSAIKTDGTMWMWGRGSNGVTGHNNTTQYSSPKQVGTSTTWDSGHQKFDTTYLSTTALKTDGTAWSWGKNGEGMLGLGDRTDRSSPTQIGGNENFNTVALFREGLNFTTTNT